MSTKKHTARKVTTRNWSLEKFTASVKRNCARRNIPLKSRMTLVKSAYDEGLSVSATVNAIAGK